MKKIIGLLLCVFMLAGVAAYAEETPVGMANPWVEMNKEDAEVKSGYIMNIPEGAENVHFLYNDILHILEMDFEIDGQAYTARMASSAETDTVEDISGMHYEWTSVEEFELQGLRMVEMRAKDGDNTVCVCNALDVVPGFVYSVSTIQPDADGLDLSAILLQVYAPMQGEA